MVIVIIPKQMRLQPSSNFPVPYSIVFFCYYRFSSVLMFVLLQQYACWVSTESALVCVWVCVCVKGSMRKKRLFGGRHDPSFGREHRGQLLFLFFLVYMLICLVIIIVINIFFIRFFSLTSLSSHLFFSLQCHGRAKPIYGKVERNVFVIRIHIFVHVYSCRDF